MTPEHLADIHRRSFTNTRPWTVAEFNDLLANPYCFAVGNDRAFAVGRVVAGEAELLTLATDPAARRHGHARKCLEDFEAQAKERAATSAFLEVAADNSPAIALYESFGYRTTATRRGYYNRNNTLAVDAYVMMRLLS